VAQRVATRHQPDQGERVMKRFSIVIAILAGLIVSGAAFADCGGCDGKKDPNDPKVTSN